MFEDRNSNKKKILGVVTVLLILIVLILLIYKPTEESQVNILPVQQQDEEIQEEPIIKEEVIKQSESTSIYKARVLQIIDRTSSILYVVEIGVGESKTESKILATMDTIIYDAPNGVIVGPNAIKENMEIMFYGVGNYNIGDLTANALVIGGDNNLKFGKIKEIYKSKEGEYIGNIVDTGDYIRINENTKIENGISKERVVDLQVIYPMSSVFYYVNPEFKQTQEGILYDANRLVVVNFND